MMLAALLAALCLTNVAAAGASAPLPSIASQLRGYKAAAGAQPQARVQTAADGYDEGPAVRLGLGESRGCNYPQSIAPGVTPLFFEQDLICKEADGSGGYGAGAGNSMFQVLGRHAQAVATCDFVERLVSPFVTVPGWALDKFGSAKVSCVFNHEAAGTCDPALARVMQLTADVTCYTGKAYSHAPNGTYISGSCAGSTRRQLLRAAKEARRSAKVAAAAAAPAGSYGRGESRNPYYEQHYHGRYDEHDGVVMETLYYGDVGFCVGSITAVSGPEHAYAQQYAGGSIEWVGSWQGVPVTEVTNSQAIWIEGAGVRMQFDEAAGGGSY